MTPKRAVELQRMRRRTRRRVACVLLSIFCVLLVLFVAFSAVERIVHRHARFFVARIHKELDADEAPLILRDRGGTIDDVTRILDPGATAAEEPKSSTRTSQRTKLDASLARLLRVRRNVANMEPMERVTMCGKKAKDREDEEEEAPNDVFPPDLFTVEQRQRGAIVLHFCGLIYMFVALAIVCDEYFVPALGVITEKLVISDDVAGATFMAAGGSAPEFFTSVFGVFITQNNVGIGTIVGSATFNILCVLAFCTLFSTTMLQLTWWPLFRDMSFYIVALFLLVVFFLDEKIVWQESLALLLLYCIYAVVMKYNVQLEHWVKRHVVRKTACSTVSSSTVMAANGANGVNGVNGANGGAISTVSGGTYKSEHRRSIPVLHAGTMFRTGLVHMALDESPEDMHHHHHHQRQQNGARPERSSRLGMHDTPGANGLPPMNNSLHGLEAQTLAKTNGNANGFAHPVPQRAATVPSMSSSSSEPEKPVDISWPQSPLAQMLYVVLVPIVFPLYFTLPDVKKPSARKYVVVTFIGSVLWIACYSYLMVWWANTIGETLRIPNEIMGLTVLAAGTSIPDLITSVIVARKGLGDMAVSSSIGSNMFDICVGLPVPWLIHFGVGFLRTGMTPLFISVSSNGLLCSVGMLFLMLIVLVVSIAVTDWRMNKSFGVLMILAYVVFCIFSVLLEMGHVVCPLRPVGLAC